MALLLDAVEMKKFDVRMVEKNLSRGNLSQKDVEAHLKTLPDDGESAEYISLDEIAASDGKKKITH